MFAERINVTQKSSKDILDELFNMICELSRDHTVQALRGIAFSSAIKDGHTARNPRTGEIVEIPAKRVPKVKVGKAFKDAVL